MSAVVNALEVSNLRRTFGGVVAVDDVSFVLPVGKLLALIGPNGAGKTTCFNMLNGQLRPDSGSIRLNGRELVGLKPREVWRMGVGRTFQITATYSSMTVSENVQMALMSHHRNLMSLLGRAANRHVDAALALLDRVGMLAQADRPCSVLAYGDLKRVELAIALANDPSVLLMDEPTAGMAPGERVELMALTAQIVAERGVSVLFTEHDMDVVFRHADTVMVLDHGSLVATGTPAQVRADAHVQAIYLGSSATANEQHSNTCGHSDA
jgi:branched-chain amino acid transport system ATP-binding protein